MRTLNRPMFRTGGSAGTGITSGLAPRQGYQNGETVMSPAEKEFLEKRALLKKYQQPRGNDMNQFLIDFGLNMVSGTPRSNIFATAAEQAKGPFTKFQASRADARTAEDKLNQALLGDVMEMETRRYEADKKYGEGKGKEFEYAGKYADYKVLVEKQRELESQIDKLQKDKEQLPPGDDGSIINEQIKRIEKQLEDNQKYQGLFVDKEEDAVRAAILKGIANGIFTFEDLVVYDETGAPPAEELAVGGRVGYQSGMSVMPTTMPEQQQPVMGEDSPAQSLSYEELRQRLPSVITNDIVTLLSTSQQALADFANITSERDVKEFNRKYDVELVLPQEA